MPATDESRCAFCSAHVDGFWAELLELTDRETDASTGHFVCTRCVNIATLSGYGVRRVEHIRVEQPSTGQAIVVLVVFIALGIALGALLAVVYPGWVS